MMDIYYYTFVQTQGMHRQAWTLGKLDFQVNWTSTDSDVLV